MLREELLDLQRVTQSQQREAMNGPPGNQCLYCELHRYSSMIREFFQSIVEPYRLDEDVSVSSASVDSGTNSVEENI